MPTSKLNDSIQFLKSVGPKRAEVFASCGLKTIRDLLFYFPSRYLDRTTIISSNKAFDLTLNGFDGEITIIAKVVNKESRRFGKKEIFTVNLRDKDGFFSCVWFQGVKYFKDRFESGQIFAISGKPTISKYNELQFTHPDFDQITEDESQVFYNTGKIIPFYRISKELKSRNIGDLSLRKIISYALETYINDVEETLPRLIIQKHNLLSLKETVQQKHFPESDKMIKLADQRLKFEELFYLEILVAARKHNYKEKVPGISLPIRSKIVRDFLKILPFELTDAQKNVLHDIRLDMASTQPMNRLLQGDVGSGKTIVALISMLITIDNGYQAVLMAPTEILADQHSKNISNLLQKFNETFPDYKVNVSLLIGGQKKSERNKQLESIVLQEANIIIGTHALFEESVQFKNLGLVVIDEQHRFGVVQRALLMKKGTTPDVLVMSATPIPRTLSMTVYGDLDISIINEMPKNRIPIKTYLRGESRLPDIYSFVIKELAKGNQSFIVYPLVEESEKLELKAATSYYNELKETYFKEINVGLIHGKMKWREKEEIMFLFAEKKLDVLISTTVIEVGIDIPSANIMIINDAHRFGLSQLHQLRGRIGRGTEQSHCILVTKDEFAASTQRFARNLEYLSSAQLDKYKSSVRLQAMVKYLDGFKIAEIDLKLRGPGDIFGIQQSGFPEFRYVDITTDGEILIEAKREAFAIVDQDPQLRKQQNDIVRKHLINHYSNNLKYANIA
jgi:ATP-dependent DNA helicase RecG